MRRKLLYLAFSILPLCAYGQHYSDSITHFRQKYKQDFLEDARSPLTANDTAYLRFYPANAQYRVTARFIRTLDTQPFTMLTHSGKMKHYSEYGYATFKLNKKICTLYVYQSLDLIAKDAKYKNDLFIPFHDQTNYAETFGGGRYLDLTIQDIHDGTLEIDFNKCYNPYCAFKGGYACPIPPKENDLAIAIRAGEKLFGKPVKE